jgi:hypothetical protein
MQRVGSRAATDKIKCGTDHTKTCPLRLGISESFAPVRPIAAASNEKTGTLDSRITGLDVAPRANVVDQKRFSVQQGLTGKSEVAENERFADQRYVRRYSTFSLKIIPEIFLRRSMPTTSNRHSPRFADVEDLIRSGCEVGIQAPGCSPADVGILF